MQGSVCKGHVEGGKVKICGKWNWECAKKLCRGSVSIYGVVGIVMRISTSHRRMKCATGNTDANGQEGGHMLIRTQVEKANTSK